jgi:hypothetical protein
MAAAKKFRFVGYHAEEIVSGQFSGPGEEVSLSAEDQKDPNVQRLIEEGQLIELHPRKEEAK